MPDSSNAPVFAGRYRFEPVGDDWDKGRSGYTHLVYDLKTKRLGVIKRAEISSEQSIKGLKNEVEALRALRGMGVPEVYDTGTALYGSKKYFYLVMEYIEGIRVEANLDSFNIAQRVTILTKFFWLLALAHSKGIVNGDIDLKHLFWQNDKKQLIVIDWGNAKLGVDTMDETKFAYDLARGAEIIFSLVTRQGHPPPTGSLVLPDDSALVPHLPPLPLEFYDLCKWAPRTPTENGRAPYTAQDLFEISQQWPLSIGKNPPKKRLPYLKIVLIIILIGVTAFGTIRKFFIPVGLTTPTASPVTITKTQSSAPSNTAESFETPSPEVTPTALTLELTSTLTVTPQAIPSPRIYKNEIVVFDNTLTSAFLPVRLCWRKDISPTGVRERESFFRLNDYDWWAFVVDKEREYDIPVQASLHECISDKSIGGMALNTWVARLEPERDGTRGREFGIFLEDENGNRREYTLWIDKDQKMHLRILEKEQVTGDNIVSVVTLANLQRDGNPPKDYYKFPIQIFLEIDNQGLDILYLQEQNAPYRFISVEDFDPNQMIRIDYAIRPTLENIQKVGLVGRGGNTEVVIWPLVFFGK